jgi:Family of unknown function (DUF6338)
MELSALTLRVLLLFFPGVVCAMLVDALTVHRERTPAQFLTNAFVLGLTSYLLLYTGQWICAGIADLLDLRPPLPVTFIDALLNEKLRVSGGEIAAAAGMAVALGLSVSAAINQNLLYRSARTLRITRRRGGLDVWNHLLDSPRTNWILARDLDHGLAYVGWLQAFSETAENAELLLRNAAVIDSATGTKLYDAATLYFARDVRSLSIEVLSADQGANDVRPDFPPIGALRGGEVQPGRVEPESPDPAAELRDRAPGSQGAHASPDQRKRKRRR